MRKQVSTNGLGLVVDEPVKEQVGSAVMYEVVQKKGQNVLMAKRCSRRHSNNLKQQKPID